MKFLNTLLLKLSLFVFLSFYGVNANAQQDTIVLIYDYTPAEGLLIKWLPESEETFVDGLQKGYKLYRSEVQQAANGSEKLGDFELLTSAPIMPWSLEKLEKVYEKDTTYGIAGIFIAGADEYLNRPYAPDPASAIAEKENDKLFHLLGIYSSVSNNKVAEAVGMLYRDTAAVLGKKYLYKIEVNDKEKPRTSYLLIPKLQEKSAGKVAGVTAKMIPKAVSLTWFLGSQNKYIHYDIYRSTHPKKGFVKINKTPYIGGTGNANNDLGYADYQDSIPAFNTTYYYKVVGTNAFERQSEASNTVEVYANYLLSKSPIMKDVDVIGNSDVFLNWDFSSEEEAYVTSFNVFRASQPEGPYLQVNEKLLSAKTRNFADLSLKGSSNYYVVSAYGSYGDSTNSNLRAALLVDSIPPAKPQGLSATVDSSGRVFLTWQANTEKDLRGYRIFRSNTKETDMTRLVPGDTLTEAFTDSIDLNIPYRKIYYKIHALDQHLNPSEASDILEVKLPDFTPPQSGFIYDFSVGMQGIELTWKVSSSEDLAKVKLMRKSDTDFEYTELISFSGDSLRINHYLDTTTKSFARYQYALMAKDSSGLNSELSKPMVVEQLDKRKIPSVKNLVGEVSKENKMLKLSWDFNGRALVFRIYRSRNGGELRTYKRVDGREREFYDKVLKPRSKYSYVIVAEMQGGYKSGFSEKITLKY